MLDRLPEVTKRSRLRALVALLVLQTAFFAFFLRAGPVVVADNVRYETGGYNIATGRGLALPFSMSPDPDVRDWVCSRHPDACEDGAYPSAQYPPGYQFFIAAVYVVAGRSLWALMAAQLFFHWLLFVSFEIVAARYLTKTGYWFAVFIGATYPFLARQSTMVMADAVHASLLMASLAALLTMKPGVRRGLLFGGLLGAATLVRTYSIVAIPFLFAWPRIFRAFKASKKEWVLAAAVCILPFTLWAARNAYWFGRFIPFSTTGIGASLYLNKLEEEIGETYQEENAHKIFQALKRDGQDPTNFRFNKELTREGLDWMKDHPGTVARQFATRVPRLWISKGTQGHGVSRAYPILIVYLGGLLVLGVAGIWLQRRDGRWNAVALVIILYWGFLLHTPAEARRTLALRLPMLVFAGFAVEEGVRLWGERRRRIHESASVR